MNLHFLCVFSLGEAEATLIMPGCLFAVTGTVNKPPFSISTFLNSVRSALWFLTMKSKDIWKHQLYLPCSLKLSCVEVWWVTTIPPGCGCCGMVVPHQCPHHAAVPQGNLHTRTAPAPLSIPNAAEHSSSPVQQKGFALLSAFTQSTHTFPPLPISVYDPLYPHLMGLNCSNSILVSMEEDRK